MALTLEGINKVKQRTRMYTRKPGVTENLRALFKHMEAKGNPDLQFVALDYYGRADQVIADAACRVYALYLLKPTASTTDAWVKVSNHATTAAAAGDIVVYMAGTGGGAQAVCLTFNDGLIMGTGATTAAHTAVDGSTDTATADAPAGFAIIGAA